MLWGVGNGPINCGNEENVGCYFPLEETARLEVFRFPRSRFGRRLRFEKGFIGGLTGIKLSVLPLFTINKPKIGIELLRRSIFSVGA